MTESKKQAEREAFFDFYKQNKEPEEEKEQNKDWMYQQREQNELGADYFSYQGYHPPKK
jgi:formylmethanofuran dehydrogenase subunit E